MADLWIALGAVLFAYGLTRRSSDRWRDTGRFGSLMGGWPTRIAGLAAVVAVSILAVIAA